MIRSEGMLNRESVRSPYPSPLSAMDPYDFDDMLIAAMNRDSQKNGASRLPRLLGCRYYSESFMNQKNTCIWSGGTLSWKEALYGIMWVAVHGIDSICAVTRIEDLEHEITLRTAMWKESTPENELHIFTNGLIGKVEGGGRKISDFVDPSTKHLRSMQQIIKKPFGVVSVFPGTKIVCTVNGLKALGKYDEENAIKFLQNEMESGVDFTFDKTVQTAICALDHLFHHDFKANEIQVFVWKNDRVGQAKPLPHIRKDLDIEEHLAAINKTDSCVREDLDFEEVHLDAINKPDSCVR